MQMEWFDVKMHPEMRVEADRMAYQRDISVGQVIRDFLAKEISRTRQAKPPVRADEQLVTPLRARLADDLAHATSWSDLTGRLAQKGYALRAAGCGLVLHRLPGDQRICKASELGFSYSRLMRRFRAPLAGHSHTWLAERVLQTTQNQTAAPEDAPDSGLNERLNPS